MACTKISIYFSCCDPSIIAHGTLNIPTYFFLISPPPLLVVIISFIVVIDLTIKITTKLPFIPHKNKIVISDETINLYHPLNENK